MHRSFPALLMVLAVFFFASAEALGIEPDSTWYVTHTYIGANGCLTVGKGQRLRVGSEVLLFEEAKPITKCRVRELIGADSARLIFDPTGRGFSGRGFDAVYLNKPLWNRFGCFWGLRDYGPGLVALAKCGGEDPDDDGAPLALEGLPASALTIGGNGAALSPEELKRIHARVSASVPTEFATGKSLLAARRYATKGNELIELFLGRPFYNTHRSKVPIDSIHIHHAFLHNGKVITSFGKTRVSGQEEHVDLEPPQLDPKNWYLDTFSTLGFFSLDGGSTWIQVNRDIGFEGIHWMLWKLQPEMPLLWDFYLYTAH